MCDKCKLKVCNLQLKFSYTYIFATAANLSFCVKYYILKLNSHQEESNSISRLRQLHLFLYFCMCLKRYL